MSNMVTITAGNMAYKGAGKPYLAEIMGLDKKFGFERQFLPRSANITECCIVEQCDYDKKDRKDITIWAVVRAGADLHKISIRDETAIEILKSGRKVDDIAAYLDDAGKVQIRRDGVLQWRTDATALIERRDQLLRELAQIEAQIASACN